MGHRYEVPARQRALIALKKNGLTYHEFLSPYGDLDDGDAMDCDFRRENRERWDAGGPFTSMFFLPDQQELTVHANAARTATRFVLE